MLSFRKRNKYPNWNYLKYQKILASTQSGFKKRHICFSAVINVTDDILTDFENGKSTTLVLLIYFKDRTPSIMTYYLQY